MMHAVLIAADPLWDGALAIRDGLSSISRGGWSTQHQV